MADNIFWAIRDWDGAFFCGTKHTRLEAIAEFVHDMNITELPVEKWPDGRSLSPNQRTLWKAHRRRGMRCIKVRLMEVRNG